MTQKNLERANDIQYMLDTLKKVKIYESGHSIQLSTTSTTVFLNKELGTRVKLFFDQIKNELQTEFENL